MMEKCAGNFPKSLARVGDRVRMPGSAAVWKVVGEHMWYEPEPTRMLTLVPADPEDLAKWPGFSIVVSDSSEIDLL